METNLAEQLSERSDSFFSTLSNLQDLFSEVNGACLVIEQLRAKLKIADVDITHKGMLMARLQQRKKLLFGVLSKVS